MKINKNVLLIVFIYLLNCINAFNIKSSTIIEKNTNVLGVEFDYALMDLEFDREVYRVRNVPCGNYDCQLPIVNGIDCSCDYADPNKCGKELDPSCNRVCNTTTSQGYNICEDYEWTQIEGNKPTNFQSSDVIYLRYKSNSTICEGLRIEASQNQGRFHMIITNLEAISGRITPNVNPDSFIQPAFCPSDNGKLGDDNQNLDVWNLDTYFITIVPDSSFIDINITIISKEIPPVSDLPTQTCANITIDHECIVDGIPVSNKAIVDGEKFFYTFLVEKAAIYSFSAPSISQDIDFFISDSPSIMYPDYDSSAKWDCSNENDDYITLSLKPNSDGTPKVLYIGVTAFYASEFTFTVTSLGYQELVPIYENFPRGGAFALLGSSRLILPNNSIYRCNFWFLCVYFTILFPFQESFPVWPIPTNFADDYRFNQITFYSEDNVPASSHYSSAFLLSTTEGDFQQLNKEFNDLVNSSIEFLSVLVDEHGEPLEGIFSFTLKNLTCDHMEFNKVLEKMDQEEGMLYNNTDFGVVNSIIFSIDTLTLSNSWTACSQRANSYLQTTDKLVNKSLSICSYSPTDPEYDLDPCCNVTLSFFQCCQPKNIQVNVSEFIDVHKDLISDQCFSTDCTESVLREYYSSLSVVGECDVPAFVSTKSALEMRIILRECKENIKLKKCTQDSDCSEYGSDTVCELFTRTCMVPPEQLDLIYLSCVFDRLPAVYTYTFLNAHGLQYNETMIEDILNVASMEDCTYVSGFSYRSTYSYYSGDVSQDRDFTCYATKDCLDLSCQTTHDVCFDGQVGNWFMEKSDSLDTCADFGFCPVGEFCNGVPESSVQCEDACNLHTEYCGYCSSNSSDCFYFKEATTKTTCQNKDACLLPNGEYQFGITATACEAKGECSVPCDRKCVGNGFKYCAILGKDSEDYPVYFDQAACTAITGAIWNSTLEICYMNTTKTEAACKAGNKPESSMFYIWTDCESLPNDECYDVAYGTCHLQDIKCTTKAQCEKAGSCSDSYFFNPENTPEYPLNLGKCVRGHFVYKSGFFIPSCDCYAQKDSPMGCFSYYPQFYRKSTCLTPENQELGYSWWSPAKTQETCEAKKGCKILDTSTYNLPYNFRFNNMTEEECSGCGQDSFNSWENLFKWTGGVWQQGIPVKAQWRENKYIKSGVVKNVLDYQYLFAKLGNSVNTHIADLYRSEVLCRMERVEGNLRSISCSCSDYGSPECFSSSSLLLGQTKPCSGENSTYSFSYGELLFYGNSVQLGCTSVLVSQVSQQLYKSTTAQTLSSNFVSYKKPNNYGVMNDQNAIIGTILGDGVTINTQGVSILSICLQYNGTKYSNEYKVYDFAMASSSTPLRPMELETFTVLTTDGVRLLCGNITNFTEDKSFFPIIRFESYIDESKEYFDKTAQGLIYTLAVIFLLTSLWGIFQITMVFVKKYKGIEQIRLVHFLILIVTLFILVRTIYFFIIPSGVLQNNSVGDYVLVVLPTFIYFTAFTIIISLWYMIVSSKDSGKTLLKRLKAIILWTNVVLYLLFIIIVLVFNYTEDNPRNDCGSRIVIDVSSTTAQRVVSIVYAVIQALISLVIGAAFIYLGGTLFRSMRQVKSNQGGPDSNSNQHQKKIFIVTFTCSIGFVIHCVFVLILVGANPSNIVFSFLGLIITEIIPSLSIFYCYNQGHFSGLKQSTNTVNLSYVTPNKENFSKHKNSTVTDSNFYSTSTNQSKNYSSNSSI
ncbi:hypothetical protein DICPUDRAFT_81582 [Dictyostelium purpureum]|uniref:THH1/TOM1/TOM3 domain-containing protein n=1 Tax=Dictyostelium purpureum TaxID=5786 RepID=F0ZTY0_DICPU|nr:uncharacterized protein DICPUDRAFT_81582 [Dictyostelium purpureum]EGC32582.1 hypothetical protein DICPUDRAFT_81582 [Dictyostelium purpureum]|eukprot:XP_003290873.1 hypothetical protein DICPUDRAFT_81582 [Dictyostelium purpureum]